MTVGGAATPLSKSGAPGVWGAWQTPHQDLMFLLSELNQVGPGFMKKGTTTGKPDVGYFTIVRWECRIEHWMSQLYLLIPLCVTLLRT